jgi:hypothetical protein
MLCKRNINDKNDGDTFGSDLSDEDSIPASRSPWDVLETI